MKGITRYYFLLFLIAGSFSYASPFPADSVLVDKETNILEKCFLCPIALWQRFSYNTSMLNCQFAPSCSNFMAQSISTNGVLPGIIMGTDRIVRCNPAAYSYHVKHPNPKLHSDGRIVDTISPEPFTQQKNNPHLGIALSIIPGLGRAYTGKTLDGIISFTFIFGIGTSSIQYYERGLPNEGLLTGMVALLFWTADIYGTYRSAIYY